MSESDEHYIDELEGKVMGLESDLDSLLHASIKCAIRNKDEQLLDYLNLNYNPFVLKHYPDSHETIQYVRMKR